MDHLDTLRTYTQYKKSSKRILLQANAKSVKLAVVIHLFYPEMWPIFESRLMLLDRESFDLFVTVPVEKIKQAPDIPASFPRSYVIPVPNRGRDVLPFIKVMTSILSQGYEYCLKMHSKKSPQHVKGDEWANELLDKLLPSSKQLLKSIVQKMDNPETGMIGPSGNYLPLTTYYPDNHNHIMKALGQSFGSQTAKSVENHKEDYGFFAGTMFWARIDGLMPILSQNFPIRYFAPERKQLDGTFSHGLERVFSVGLQLQGKKFYACNGRQLMEIEYKSHETQEWWDKAMRSGK